MSKGRVSTKSVFQGKAVNGEIYTIRFLDGENKAWTAYFQTGGEPVETKAAHRSLTILKNFLGIKSLKQVKETDKEPVTA